MKKELISVILPIWNPHLKQLKQCLDSIVNQTYDNLEIISIYRNSSMDKDFFSFMEQYRDDKRLKIIITKEIGISKAVNEGIKKSTAELIGRIDADDYCDLTRFEKQLEYKYQKKPNILGTWAYHISNDGKILFKTEKPICHSEIRKKIMFHFPMSNPTILMDKKILKTTGLYDPYFDGAEDYEFFLRAMHYGSKFANLPKHLVYTRETPGSSTRGKWRKQRTMYMKAKTKALLEYGFIKPYDIFYYCLSPISYFISPKTWIQLKKFIGWYK